MSITATAIGTNKYAAEGVNDVLLYNRGDAQGLTLAQLIASVCFSAAAVNERQSVVKMNMMNAGTEKLDKAAEWFSQVADGTANWAQAKAFCINTLGIPESGLPADLNSYANRVNAAKAMKEKMDQLAQTQQEDMVDLQTMVNRRDVAYTTSTNIITSIGSSAMANASNLTLR